MKNIKKIILTLLVAISLLQMANAQPHTFEWAKKIGAIGGSPAIITDASGNVFTTGTFQGTVDFDPGPNEFNLSSAGSTDIFISKSDGFGNFIWAKSFGGSGFESDSKIATDSLGHIYIAGGFSGTVDFDLGVDNFFLTSNGGTDIFILKLDTSGNFIWANQIGGVDSDNVSSILLDPNGRILICGTFRETVDFDPSSNSFIMTSGSVQDAFILKLDTSGNFIWAKQFKGNSMFFSSNAESIATDYDANVIITGYFRGTVDFDPSINVFELTSAVGFNNDIFIVKLDSFGDLVWVKHLSGVGDDYGKSISTDLNGNVYCIGTFRETVDFDPGANTFNISPTGDRSVFIVKLSALGDFIWANKIGGPGFDFGTKVLTDENGFLYLSGNFEGSVNFDQGNSNTSLSSSGGTDIFICKLDTLGNFQWVKKIGGNGTDQCTDLHKDFDGNIYVTGLFSNTANFDPNESDFSLTSSGSGNTFIAKFFQCVNTTETVTVSTCDSFTWIDGITYTESNNTATVTLPNAAGCDSVVALNLTINQSNTGIDVINACEPYTWIDGVTYTESNNTATFTIPNASNCDSVVTLNLTIQSVDNSVTENAPIITANASDATYQWLNCNDNYAEIDGETAQNFTAIVSGSYAVEVTQNGCVDTSACFTLTNVSINNLASIENINIYPNPTKKEVYVDLTGISEVVEIEIYDLIGNKIISKNSEGKPVITFDLNQHASGVYLIKVSDKFSAKTLKLVKQ